MWAKSIQISSSFRARGDVMENMFSFLSFGKIGQSLLLDSKMPPGLSRILSWIADQCVVKSLRATAQHLAAIVGILRQGLEQYRFGEDRVNKAFLRLFIATNLLLVKRPSGQRWRNNFRP